MSWISGIAGRAEELLNRLDENTAVALKKNKFKKPVIDDSLIEVTSTEGSDKRELQKSLPVKQQTHHSNNSCLESIQPLSSNSGMSLNSSLDLSPSLKSSPRHLQHNIVKSNSTSKLQKLGDEDEQLIQFLNNKNSTFNKDDNSELKSKDNSLNYNSSMKENNRSIYDATNSHDISTTDREDGAVNVDKENQMLRNEVRTVNNEMSLLLHRTKAAEKESERLKQELQESQRRISRLQADLQGVQLQLASDDERIRTLQAENDRLTGNLTSYNESSTHASIEMNSTIDELKQHLLDTQLKESAVSTELTTLKDRLRISDEEKLRTDGVKHDLETQLQIVTQRLSEIKNEFEHYRTKAQRTLSNKEKLITELRKSSTEIGGDNVLEMELQQLREERAALSEECQQMSSRLELVREELSNTERKLEAAKEESAAIELTLQESLLQEQRRREVAEEDCRAQSEELHSIREELSRQRTQLTARLREREAELTRLRSQLTQRPASPPQIPVELEARLSALTTSLVQKQANVEVLASEKNALRLQLEKTEYKYREAAKLLNQIQGRTINVNDTDDAKAQVPSFLIESPFDTGVTRRVKRAYSSLDAVGIRTSVFLRRYPLARILIMFYVVLLHLWVFLVLFSYTPAAEPSVNMKQM